MTDAVGDDEQLYRRVQESVGGQLCYQVVGDRIVFLHFLHAAFNDPQKRPSVDRAILKYREDPHLADGVLRTESFLFKLPRFVGSGLFQS